MPVDARHRTLRRLSLLVALQWSGATLALPLLPLYLEHRGGSPAIIGPIMAAFPFAGLLTQFIFGRLTDKFGRGIMMTLSLVAYAVGSAIFALPLSAPWFMLARAIQGAGAGGFEVASLASVTALFPENERGRASSRIIAAQLGGIAIGPLLGSLFPVSDLGWVFLGTAVVSGLASLIATRTDVGDTGEVPEKLTKIRFTHQLIGSLFGSAAVGIAIGVYESCWTLLMYRHHATGFEIRLSWSLFALPWVLLSRVGGWLADHGNRRVIAVLGLCNAGIFLSLYPHIQNPKIMVVVGSFEAIGASLSVPSVQSLLSQGADEREAGRRQGLSSSANTGALALSSAVSGVLFARSPYLPFTLVAIISVALALTTLYWWHGIRGHIHHPA
jgi:DHA1 family multidrug resistance protein-like MFS transporter